MAKKRKTWIWILVIVLILAVVVGVFVFSPSRSASSRYAEEVVRNGSIETYYSFSGNVAVRNSQAIAAKANATIREIYVEQDDVVAAGTPLMRLSNGEVIKADIAGEITDVHVSEGDGVSVGAALVDIVDFTDLQVVMKVDEYDVGAVTAGKEASVTIDALSLTYDATIEHISKQAQGAGSSVYTATSGGGDVTYYEAKLTAPVDERILPGMKVDVKILNAREEEALLLPMTALQFDAYNKPYVYIRNSAGDVVEQEVEVGIQDGTTVQITGSLRAGDTVLVPQSNSLFPMMQRMR